MRQQTRPLSVQIMNCHVFGARPSEPIEVYCEINHWNQISVKIILKHNTFHSTKWLWKCCLQNSSFFISASVCQKLYISRLFYPDIYIKKINDSCVIRAVEDRMHIAIGLRIIALHYGPLARYVKLWVAHAPGMPGTFSPTPRVSNPDTHHGTCVTHVPWFMPR